MFKNRDGNGHEQNISYGQVFVQKISTKEPNIENKTLKHLSKIGTVMVEFNSI